MARYQISLRWVLAGLVLQSAFVACGGDEGLPGGGSGVGGGSGTLGRGGNNATGGAVVNGNGGQQSTAQGGVATGTGGAPEQGGSATGGKASTGGATNQGGAATGGKASTGGAGVGGVATGGKAVGGSSSTGGSASTGGKATGGAANQGGSATGGKSATGGAATGGAVTGGKAATGGAATGGTTSSSGPSCSTTLPAYTSSTTVNSTITITGTKDYGMQRLCANASTLGPGDQSEDQSPVIMMAKNAVLKNVIIGGSGCSAADGVHCESGSCTLENVWFGDVGEDAITFKGSDSSQVMTITGGGAFEASDKVIQHNGPGTIKINGFFVKNAGKLYRSCGNCGTQYARHVALTNVFATGVSTLVGINANYGDTATITNLTKCGSVSVVCQTFTGNSSGAEPTSLNKYTTAGDGKYCIF